MPSNQQKLDDIHWETTNEGRDFISRRALGEVTYPNAWGDQFPIVTILNGVERRIAGLDAQVSGLVGVIKAMAGGESFDEAKLLAAVQSAAEAGVKNAIDSIETTETTTVKIKEG
jgi:hypothetical protein